MPDWSKYYPTRNCEGYSDPTASGAFEAISREQEDEDRLRKIVTTLKNIAELCGYDVINRIELRDRKNGRIYR